MDTKKIITIILIFALVLLLINSFRPSKEKIIVKTSFEKLVPKVNEITCEQKCSQDVGCLSACYYVDINKAVTAGDLSLCNKMNSLIKQECIDKINLKQALKTNDKNLCNNLVTKNVRELCLNVLK